jgi:hypothetical protein
VVDDVIILLDRQEACTRWVLGFRSCTFRHAQIWVLKQNRP